MAHDARIRLKNPNTGRDDQRIRRAVYDPVRQAILDALADAGELPNAVLRAEVESRTAPELWESNSVGWYTTSVKLDLEARGLLAKRGTPQQLRLTEAGTAAIEAVG